MALCTRNTIVWACLADWVSLVILPLPAQLAPLEMIWYVTLCAISLRLRRFRRRRSGEGTPRTAILTTRQFHWQATIMGPVRTFLGEMALT
jgi:hypothetical protein